MAYAAQPLLQINQPPSDALFLRCTSDNTLEFQIANKTHTVPLRDLVRWSNPHANLQQHEAILIDGSRLVLAESWTSKKALQISKETVTLHTKTFGKVVLPRTALQAIRLNPPTNNFSRLRLRDRRSKNDHLELTNGDTLTGQLLEIGQNGPSAKFTLDGTSEPISLPIDRLARLAFGSRANPPAKGNLAIGWRDGSYLIAKTLIAGKKSSQIKLACAVELQGDAPREIIHLQSLQSQAVYLSDMNATDYRHQPFLSLPWQYRRDRNLQDGPLTASQLIYPKGLAMHSTSRLTYDIPPPAQSRGVAPPRPKRFHRFAAQCAIDDSTDGRGSVVFQVFLRRADELKLALTTPIVRGKDTPLPISVELAGAEQIVLVVENADRGDQSDHANWLDARLE